MPLCLPCSLRPLGSFIADPAWTFGNSLTDADEDAVAATAKSTPFLNRLMVDGRDTTDELKAMVVVGAQQIQLVDCNNDVGT
jgi:hypothetical protein